MINPFKFWEEMLDIYEQTVKGSKEDLVEYVDMDVCIPAELEHEFVEMLDAWLRKKGY